MVASPDALGYLDKHYNNRHRTYHPPASGVLPGIASGMGDYSLNLANVLFNAGKCGTPYISGVHPVFGILGAAYTVARAVQKANYENYMMSNQGISEIGSYVKHISRDLGLYTLSYVGSFAGSYYASAKILPWLIPKIGLTASAAIAGAPAAILGTAIAAGTLIYAARHAPGVVKSIYRGVSKLVNALKSDNIDAEIQTAFAPQPV